MRVWLENPGAFLTEKKASFRSFLPVGKLDIDIIASKSEPQGTAPELCRLHAG